MSNSLAGIDTSEARRRHRGAWVAALAAGCLLIAVGNLFDWWPWLLAMLAVSLMGMFVAAVRGTDVGSDAKGDSIYYLGLLFTFAALVAALIAFDWQSGANSTLGVIRNFGIALLTTIAGLAWRVWYAMSAESPGDLEEVVRGDLEGTVSAMKGSLDRARDVLDIMTNKFEASAERMEGIANRAGTAGQQMSRAVAGIAEGTETAARTAEKLEGMLLAMARATRSTTDGIAVLGETVDESVEATKNLRRSLGSVEEGAVALGRRLTAADNRVERLGVTLAEAGGVAANIAGEIGRSADDVTATSSAVAALRATISTMSENAARAQAALAGAAIRATESGANVQTALEDAATHAERGGAMIRRLARRAEEADGALAGAHGEANSAREASAEVARRADDLAEWLAVEKQDLSASVESAGRRARDLGANIADVDGSSEELAEALATARKRVQALDEAITKARTALPTANTRPRLFGRLRDFGRRRKRDASAGKTR